MFLTALPFPQRALIICDIICYYQGKSALWSHLLAYQQVEECHDGSMDPNLLTPGRLTPRASSPSPGSPASGAATTSSMYSAAAASPGSPSGSHFVTAVTDASGRQQDLLNTNILVHSTYINMGPVCYNKHILCCHLEH